MATSFPTSLDSFTNPSASDALDSVSVPHADQHSNLNDAVEALQAKVGVDGSTVTSSLDYQRGLVHIDTFTGTGVSAANFDDVFTSDFDAFRVVVRLRTLPSNLFLRYRVGGVDSTAANYNYVLHGLSSAGSALNVNSSGAIYQQLAQTNISSTVARQGCVFDVIYPNLAYHTTIMGAGQSYNTGGNYWTYNVGGAHVLNNAYDGFSIFPVSGTISHTTSIYGYNNG